MWEAPATNISRAEVLEVCMYSLRSLVLSSSITCAGHHIETVQAHSCQLLLDDATDIHTLLAWAVHDVPQEAVLDDRRFGCMFPFRQRDKGSPIDHRDLESHPSKTRLARRAHVCCQCNTCQLVFSSHEEQIVGGVPVHGSIEEQKVLVEGIANVQQLVHVPVVT